MAPNVAHITASDQTGRRLAAGSIRNTADVVGQHSTDKPFPNFLLTAGVEHGDWVSAWIEFLEHVN